MRQSHYVADIREMREQYATFNREFGTLDAFYEKVAGELDLAQKDYDGRMNKLNPWRASTERLRVHVQAMLDCINNMITSLNALHNRRRTALEGLLQQIDQARQKTSQLNAQNDDIHLLLFIAQLGLIDSGRLYSSRQSSAQIAGEMEGQLLQLKSLSETLETLVGAITIALPSPVQVVGEGIPQARTWYAERVRCTTCHRANRLGVRRYVNCDDSAICISCIEK